MELARAFRQIVGRRFAARAFTAEPVDPAVLRDCLSMTQARHPASTTGTGPCLPQRGREACARQQYIRVAYSLGIPPCSPATAWPADKRGFRPMAQRAPSSFNTQPWVAIVVTSEQRKAALAAAMLGDNGSKVCVCVCAAPQRNPNLSPVSSPSQMRWTVLWLHTPPTRMCGDALSSAFGSWARLSSQVSTRKPPPSASPTGPHTYHSAASA